jgi:hypothetical protein
MVCVWVLLGFVGELSSDICFKEDNEGCIATTQ